MDEPIFVKIESCRDCSRLRIKRVNHWLLGHMSGYEYICTQEKRNIYPSEGVKPPPSWCPKRKKED